MEEDLAAGAIEGDEAELVDDQQVDALELALQAAQLALVAGLDELAHQIGGAAKQNAVATLGGLQPQGDGEVGLAGADRAGEDDVLGAVEVVAAGELGELGLGDPFEGLPVDLLQGLVIGKLRRS